MRNSTIFLINADAFEMLIIIKMFPLCAIRQKKLACITNCREKQSFPWPLVYYIFTKGLKNIFFSDQYMPIITPTFPHLNSSFNVSSNTMKLIQQKMLVAAGTCDKIVEGKDSWDSLFKVDCLK